MNYPTILTGVIVGLYFILLLFVGLKAYNARKQSPEDYFLAGRKIGPLVLFFTLMATNFSAFFFLGFAGSGYRIGYSYYAMMGLSTAFVALAFYFIGAKAWKIAKKKKYLTAPELFGGEANSPTLRFLVLIVMLVFTIPYLALQPIGAGYILSTITDGGIPYFLGAALLTAAIVIYTFIGGMRSVAWTDVVQGMMMFTLMIIALVTVSNAFGGLSQANLHVFAERPDLFTREGGDGFFTPEKWFSFMILWVLSVPLFPHIFMRFYTAKSERSLKASAVLYPLVTAVLFLAPVAIGVMGHIAFPDLEGRASDNILPLLLSEVAPLWLAIIIMAGGLAAFMSTLDSQLLALSSLITRDFFGGVMKKTFSLKQEVRLGKWMVVLLALIGLGVAYQPPATIQTIATQAFTGIAVLFPTIVALLHLKSTNVKSCILSVLVGEALVVGFALKLIPAHYAFGFLPAIPIVAVCAAIILLGTLFFPKKA